MKRKLIIIAAILGIMALVTSACATATTAPPSSTSPSPTTSTSNAANFRMLISDEPNDIGDFNHLYVTVSSIGVQMAGDNTTWLQFTPDIGTVDLVMLQNQNAQEIFSGNVTYGTYNKVFIYISDVQGVLKSSANTTVKLPSGKLQISTPFTVSANSTSSLVFDITVIKAGGSGKYILKPQVATSGVNQQVKEVPPDKNQQQERNQERNRLQLNLQSGAQPGASAGLTVLSQSKPAAGAAVTVNGQPAGSTDAAGHLTITIPPNAVQVRVIATLGQNTGELNLEFNGNLPQTSISGTVEAINNDVWTVNVSGTSQAVDVSEALVTGNPKVGSTVEITGVTNNGVIVASRVSVKQGNSPAPNNENKGKG